MKLLLVVGLCLVASAYGAPRQCLTEPADWVKAFDAAYSRKSSATPCADKNLMIRFDTGYEATDPAGLSTYGNFWAWASDSDSMDHYMDMAANFHQNGEGFAHEIMTYLGFTDTTVSASNRYVFTVFKRDMMEAKQPAGFPVFQPKWQTLFDYLFDFTECKYTGDVDDCYKQQSIQFNDDVRKNLTNLTPGAITDCPTDFSDYTTCSSVFTEMNNALYDIRKTGGVLGATDLYAAYPNTPLLDMIDDQARAFFNIAMGATWLFTGSGSSNNGQVDTGKEWIVRGDVPIKMVGPGARSQIYP